MNNVKILVTNKKWDLPKMVASFLETELIYVNEKSFADGESWVNLPESVRRAQVFLFQENTPAHKLMILLQTIDACRRASAEEINVVIPYFGWARQDRMKGRDCVSAKLAADFIVERGAKRVLSMHLHFPQLPSFVTFPWDHIYSAYYIIDWAKKTQRQFTIVAPDYGAAPLADFIAHNLNMPLAILRKKRKKHNEAQTQGIMGSVENSDALIVDDILDTFGTGEDVCASLKKLGAQDVFVAATHGVLSVPAKTRIENCDKIKKVMITNTTPETPRKKSSKIERISVHEIFAKAIQAIHDGGSIKTLFDEELFS